MMHAPNVSGNPSFMAILKKIVPIALGLVLGFAYWYFIGCASGHCPITSTWYISTFYGGLIGATFLFPGSATRKKRSATE